jgi:hypothetical protein
MPLEFYLIMLGLILGGVIFGIYVYRKITRPFAEKMAKSAASAERDPPNLEDIGIKVKSIVDNALNSIDRIDTDSDEHPQSSDQENLEDLAAALATEQDHLKEEDEEHVPFSRGSNLLCLANILAALILFVVFIWEDLTTGYSFEDTFENVFWTAIVVSPLLLVAGLEYKLFTIRKNGYDTTWFYVIEGLLGATLAVVVYFVATIGPSEVWAYFLGAWIVLGFCLYAWQRMDPDSSISKQWRAGKSFSSAINGGESTAYKSVRRNISNSTRTSSFNISRQTKQKGKQMPTSKTVFVVKVKMGASGGMAKAGEWPTIEYAEHQADQLRKQGKEVVVIAQQK